MIPVSHYGLHWAQGDVGFLHQERGCSNALGMAIPSPFEVQPANRRVRCNHLIQLDTGPPAPEHLAQFERLSRDPLVEAMLPIPDKRPVYVANEQISVYLTCLSRMSSPIHPIVMPFWSVKPERVIDELAITNVQPLVLTHVQMTHKPVLDRIAEFLPSAARRLILTGTVLRPDIEKIPTEITNFNLEDLIRLPWEQIGSWILRGHMRHEP